LALLHRKTRKKSLIMLMCKKCGKEMQDLTSRMKSHFNKCSNNSDEEDVAQNKSAGTYIIIV